MAFDFLKKAVSEYSDRKQQLDQDNKEFQENMGKADDFLAASSGLDDEIVHSAREVKDAFDDEFQELNLKNLELQKEQKEIIGHIEREQKHLDEVDAKLEAVKNSRYGSEADRAIEKSRLLLTELDRMLAKLGQDSQNVKPVGSASFTGVSSGKGIFTGFNSGRRSAANSVQTQKFGSFTAAKIPGSHDYFVKGDHYDTFINDYLNSEQTVYKSLRGNETVTVISPSLVEGIHLGPTDVAEDSKFWSQHEKGGTMESFREIASHIPEISSLLTDGASLDEIRLNRPDLEKCADIYFEPGNIPRVIQNDTYYEFETNGRHRILAAREAGYNIPVMVVGIRRRK